MKQISRVLACVTEGYETSESIADVTGMSIATVSSYLSALADDGLIIRTERNAVTFKGRGRRHHMYALAGARP